MPEKTYTERIKVAGDQILSVVRTIIHEGNVRRLIIRNEKDQILIEVPVTVGVVGVLVAPVAAALGAVAALVTHCTIEVERVGEPARSAAGRAAEAADGESATPGTETSTATQPQTDATPGDSSTSGEAPAAE